MARWTRLVLRFRWPILVFWLGVVFAGGYAAVHLTPLLSNTFTVPGTDSERARTILRLPAPLARLVRVQPSPVARPARPALTPAGPDAS